MLEDRIADAWRQFALNPILVREREEDYEATELMPNKQGTAASRMTTASAVKRNNAAL